jgi:hypothetical protein
MMVMNPKHKYSEVDIAKRLGIPKERLPDSISRCFVFGCNLDAAGQRKGAIFSRVEVYGIALSEYLVKERLFPLEKAEKFTRLWLQTIDGVASTTRNSLIEQQKKSDFCNVLIFMNISTGEGKELSCEPVGIFGRKEAEEGYHFFKALGKILKNKLKDRPWSDLYIVNIGRIKRQVDAQLS